MTPKNEVPGRDVPARPPVYGIDSMVFVYHFEAHPEFGPAAGRLLAAAEDGRCRLVCSVLAQLEVLVVPKRNQRQDLCSRYREVFESFPNLTVLDVDSEIAEIAADLRAEYSVRTPDAIHIATALQAHAAAFVAGDGRLRKIRELPILRMDQVPLDQPG